MEQHMTAATLTDVETQTLVDAVRTIGRLASTVAAIAARQATPDTGDRVHVHVTPTAAPTPIRDDAWEAYRHAELYLKNLYRACGIRAKGTVKAMAAHADPACRIVATHCDEKHGDPHEWLEEAVSIEAAFRRIVDPPKPRRLIGLCPVCHGKVWGGDNRTVGVCDTCHTPIPTAITRNALLARLDADTGLRDTASGLSKTLAKAGIRLPAATIRTWAKRGRITADADGRYALADIIQQAKQQKE